MNKPKISVILGSIREGRAGEKVAKWFMDAVAKNSNAELELLDLRDYPLPMYADSDAIKNREGAHPIPEVEKWLEKIKQSDGYVFITPEYNHSFSSVLKNAIDYGYKQWNGKAVGFVSYGSFAGGSRAVEHLRGVSVELQLHDVRDAVVIPTIWKAFNQEGLLENGEQLAKTANLIIDKVAALSAKLKN